MGGSNNEYIVSTCCVLDIALGALLPLAHLTFTVMQRKDRCPRFTDKETEARHNDTRSKWQGQNLHLGSVVSGECPGLSCMPWRAVQDYVLMPSPAPGM